MQGAVAQPARIGVVGTVEESAGPQQGARRREESGSHLGSHPARHPMADHEVIGFWPSAAGSGGGQAAGEVGDIRQGELDVAQAQCLRPHVGLGDVGRVQIHSVEAGLKVRGSVKKQVQPLAATEFEVVKAPAQQSWIELVPPPHECGQHEPGHRELLVQEGLVDLFDGIGRLGIHPGTATLLAEGCLRSAPLTAPRDDRRLPGDHA